MEARRREDAAFVEGLRERVERAEKKVSDQEKWMREQIDVMFQSCVARDKYVDDRMKETDERIGRRRREIDLLVQENIGLKTRVESMSDKLCHCSSKSPALSGEGTRSNPWSLDLEYEDPPVTAPSSPAPPENSTPLPVPGPAAETPRRSSDAENVLPTCCASAAPEFAPMLRLVEDDEAEDEDGGLHVSTARFRQGAENRALVVRQTCIKSKKRRVDVHPYRMALGDRQQQRQRDVRLGVGRKVFPLSIQYNRRVQRHGSAGYEPDSEPDRGAVSCSH